MMKEVAVLGLAGTVLRIASGDRSRQILQSQLFGIPATDPAVLALAGAGVLVVCLLAGYLPTRRAACLDPGAILRYE